MADSYTPNLKLKKPGLDSFADIAVINDNMDLIDAEVTGLKENGIPGTPGEDGLTPYIGANGNWWVGDTDTGTPARGPKGENGDGAGTVTGIEVNGEVYEPDEMGLLKLPEMGEGGSPAPLNYLKNSNFLSTVNTGGKSEYDTAGEEGPNGWFVAANSSITVFNNGIQVLGGMTQSIAIPDGRYTLAAYDMTSDETHIARFTLSNQNVTIVAEDQHVGVIWDDDRVKIAIVNGYFQWVALYRETYTAENVSTPSAYPEPLEKLNLGLPVDDALKLGGQPPEYYATAGAVNQLSEQIENCYTKDNLVFDDAPVKDSTNPITSGAVFDAAGKYSSKAVDPTYGSDVSTYNCKLYRKGNVGFLHAYCKFSSVIPNGDTVFTITPPNGYKVQMIYPYSISKGASKGTMSVIGAEKESDGSLRFGANGNIEIDNYVNHAWLVLYE